MLSNDPETGYLIGGAVNYPYDIPNGRASGDASLRKSGYDFTTVDSYINPGIRQVPPLEALSSSQVSSVVSGDTHQANARHTQSHPAILRSDKGFCSGLASCKAWWMSGRQPRCSDRGQLQEPEHLYTGKPLPSYLV
jgi:hypothetical protein